MASRSRMSNYNEEGGGDMSGDVFNDVTDVYEAMIDWPKRLANEGRFFRRLFDNVGVRRVVDVACGTGRHGAMFHSWGLEVEGADIGTSMIERARTNLGEPATMHWVVRGFDQPIEPKEPFDAAICIGNSLALAPDVATVQRAVQEMLAAVRSGGVVVVACAQPMAFPRRPVPVAEVQTRNLGARGRLDCQRCPPCWSTRLCGPYHCVIGGVE